MLARLRRRSPAHAPTQPATPTAPPHPELTVADSDTVTRTERIRTALREAGLDLDRLGPEPSWFAQARTGQPTPLGPTERTELIAHLGSKTTACVTSDEECARFLQQIDALTVLREMHAEGITVMPRGQQLSADALRAARDIVRKAERDRAAEQPTTTEG
ncbi:hypothetical protein PV516_19015 [Streptomyces scabiei]|uniref:hypothetical protein n=1 Tax=Streptomyces scabiei TaxID=1930 RepID=UPI0029BB34A1|nr:hypothetical protein [Streptomyces scabiei]MDX3165879.1 hypothetical protein [Streptomyces scabiei]